MSKLYKLSGLLTLALPLAALADSEQTVSAAQRAESMRQMRAEQAKAMRAADAAHRAAARGQRAVAARQPKILTDVTVAGRVLDEKNKPLANVTVYVNWRTFQNKEQSVVLTTDAQGKFSRRMEIKTPSQVFRVTAMIEGKRCATKRMQLTTQPLAAIGLRLQPGLTLSGRLLASDGSPLANQNLQLSHIAAFELNGQNDFTPLMGQQMALHGGSGEPILPTDQLAKLFRARTDATGRFTFVGLPQRAAVRIAVSKPYTLAQGSMLPVSMGDKAQEAGTLVAVRPGSAAVRMVDAITGKPIAKAQIHIIGADFNSPMMQMTSNFMRGELNPTKQTDAQGMATFTSLRPGSYYLYHDSRLEKITVEDGKATSLVTFALRQEPLKGRIIDANGKPVAGLEIKMNTIMKHDDEISRMSPMVRFGEFGWETRPRATTDKNGYFSLPKSAWTGENLTIRAVRGNSLAEWDGSPAQIKGELTLTMQPNALITVTGRLIDPQRRVLKKAQFQSIHWTAAPRSFWVSNARTVQLDNEGRFKLDGLKRGESFSFITGTRSNGFAMQASGMQPQQNTKQVAFESPRFATQLTGQQQDMGDVMVHPLDDPEDLEENYGFSSEQNIAKFPGLLPAPSPDAVKEAKQALLDYRNALNRGDMKRAYAMTSRLTPGWSADYSTYLQRTVLRDSTEAVSPTLTKSAALRYVPRSVAALFVNGTQGIMFGIPQDITPIVKELNQGGEWVFLVEPQKDSVVTVGVLRKEEGQWRVLNNHFSTFFGGDPLQQIATNGLQPNSGDFNKPLSTLKPEALASARTVAERYLQEWAAGRPSALRRLTSMFAPLAATKPENFAKAFEKRVDEGVCPLMMNEQPALELVTGLSLWEQQWLANLTMTPQMQLRNRIFRQDGGMVTSQEMPDGNFPMDYAQRGDIALFRYSAQGREYIISLVRNNNKWSVLEPAFIQTEPVSHDIVMR